MTLTESSGTGVRIDRASGTVIVRREIASGFTSSVSAAPQMPASIQLPGFGTATYATSQEFGYQSGDSLAWRFDVWGTDASGRPFAASSAKMPVVILSADERD
jgi:hypothetical protein